MVIEMMGKVTEGMMGTGFLYTNKESSPSAWAAC